MHLQVPGRHYVLDAAAALVMGLRLGFGHSDLARGLADFTGTGRRMELKGEVGGVRVYDSYAHHPAEITGDVEAARALAGDGRLVVAFQPHLVSRTRIFGPAMGEALGAADEVVVLDVYVAREAPDPGVTGRLVADAVPLPPERVHFLPDLTDVPRQLARLARPGDLVLTLGAGSVTEVGPQVLPPARLTGGIVITLPRNPLKGSERRDPAVRSRRRFARRQWLRRWLVWRYVIGSVLLVVLSAVGVWLVFVSSTLTVKHVRGRGGVAADAAAGPGGRSGACRGPPRRARPGRDPHPRRRPCRRSSASTSRATGPTGC